LIVHFYEKTMSQAGVDGAQFVEAKRAQRAEQFRLQRQTLAEQEFTQMGATNKRLMDSLKGMAASATTSITGLINGTATASDPRPVFDLAQWNDRLRESSRAFGTTNNPALPNMATWRKVVQAQAIVLVASIGQ
jgi:hypothetical protein